MSYSSSLQLSCKIHTKRSVPVLNMRAQEYILSSDSKFVHADQHPKDSFAAEKGKKVFVKKIEYSCASKKWGKLWGKYLFWENSYS